MAHTIDLLLEHKEILVEVLLHSLNDKIDNVIRDKSKIPEITLQYEDAATKLLLPVKCGMKTKNLFRWVQDQILHSPGIRHTEIANRALTICEYAAMNNYDQFCKKLGLFL